VAKPNYQFEKRQKELEKKKKQEQKRLRKQAEQQPDGDTTAAGSDASLPAENSGGASNG